MNILKCGKCGMPELEGPLRRLDDNSLMCDACRGGGVLVCDFCLEPEPHWLYTCKPVTIILEDTSMDPTTQSITFDESWMSCDVCRTLVDSSDSVALVMRLMAMRGTPDELKLEHIGDFKEMLRTYFDVVMTVLERPPKEVESM